MSDLVVALPWYGLLLLVSIAAWPLATLLVGGRWAIAPWIARPVGLLVLLWPTWYLSSVGIVPFTTGGLWVSLVIVAALGWALALKRGVDLRALLRSAAVAEVAFLVLFVGALVLRGYSPDILNTEKPMDSAILATTARSDVMPPRDTWMAGERLNYYYLGYLAHGVLTRMTGTDSPVAFNLALATTTAMAILAVAGVGLLIGGRRGGLLAALAGFLVVVAGNMDGPWRVATQGLDALRTDWWSGMGWNASRVVVDVGAPVEGQTINEFPAFSIVLGDAHPHLLALPFAISALAAGIALLKDRALEQWPRFVAVGWFAGALYALNSWDLPTFLGLAILAIALPVWRTATRRQIGLGVAVLAASAVIGWAPFVVTFTPFVAGDPATLPTWAQNIPILTRILTTIGVSTWERTGAGEFLRVFGLPWAVVTLGLVAWSRPLLTDLRAANRGRTAVLALGGLAMFAFVSATPVLLLVGAPVVLAAALFVRLGMTDRRAIAAGLFALGGVIVLGTEIFFIQDVFQSRMNTLFKAYYQVWTLWGVAAAIVLVETLDRQVAPRRQVLAGLAMATAVLLGTIYPVTSALRWAEQFGGWKGLDGAAYVADWSVDEYDAIAWLRANAGPEDVVIEAPGCSYQPVSMVPTSRASAFTGVPTVIGWAGHESQWRSGDDRLQNDIGPRIDAVRRFYTQPDQATLDAYGVTFIYYGRIERDGADYGCDIATPLPRPSADWLAANGWSVAFEQGDVTIWSRR